MCPIWLGTYLRNAKATARAFSLVGMPFLLICLVLPAYGRPSWILWEETEVDTIAHGSAIRWYVKEAAENKDDCDSLVPKYLAQRVQSFKVSNGVMQTSDDEVTFRFDRGETFRYRFTCLPRGAKPQPRIK